jgi:sigma-E factor negative regulatory protein RseA
MSQYDKQLGESLSALMDGEASELDTRRVLKELSAEKSEQAELLRGKWRRYQSVSAVMSGSSISNIDYSLAISQAVAKEDTLTKITQSTWAQSSGRFVIAASVALVAIFGVQQFNQPLDVINQSSDFAQIDEMPLDSMMGPVNQFPSGFSVPMSTEVQAVSSEGYSEVEVQAYLGYILSKHASQAPYARMQGMLPYARIEKRAPAAQAE